MKKIIKEYSNYTVPFYGPAEFVVKKAKGSIVWDVDNNKYIDFTAGIAVTNLGHSNEILSKIMSMINKDPDNRVSKIFKMRSRNKFKGNFYNFR